MNLKFVTCYMLHATCYMDLLGVRIDNFSKKEILEKIESFLDEPKFHSMGESFGDEPRPQESRFKRKKY